MRDKITEILSNVEFLHGVPVQAPQKTIDDIVAFFEQNGSEKKLYKPKKDLKQVVIELAKIIAETNPGYDLVIQDLIEEMNKWGTYE